MKKHKPLLSFQRALFLSKPYWIFVLAIWLSGFASLIIYGTYDSYLQFTGIHTTFLDNFFIFFTHIGDGIFALAMAALFFFFKYRRIAVGILFSFLLSGLFVQIGKKLLASPRPSRYFNEIIQQPVPTLSITNWGDASYPSGHTATAFALMTMLILFFPKNKWNILWIVLAFLVAYSRMYVASHFLDDVLAGASIGVLSSFICYILLLPLFRNKQRFFFR